MLLLEVVNLACSHCKRVIPVWAQVLTQRQLISGSRSENEGKVRSLALFSRPAKKMGQLGDTPVKGDLSIASVTRYGPRYWLYSAFLIAAKKR